MKLGFIGGGNMATAIIGGIINADAVKIYLFTMYLHRRVKG